MADEKGQEVQKSIERDVDAWRVSQGLPPIDRSKEARHPDAAKKGRQAMAENKSLKKAVDAEVKDAVKDAKTGNEQTIDEGPDTLKEAATGENVQDLPTGARSHPA